MAWDTPVVGSGSAVGNRGVGAGQHSQGSRGHSWTKERPGVREWGGPLARPP